VTTVPPPADTPSPAATAAAGPVADAPATAAPAQDPSETIRRLRAVRALLWALVGVMVRPAPTPVTTADIGQAAPAMRLPLLGGGEIDLETYRGRPVVLNFWATWCEPCRAEMPVLEQAQQKYREQGLAVLGVDLQERDEDVQAFLTQIGVTFPTMMDRTGEVARQWRATGLPTTFLIDRQGIIRDVRVGPFTHEMLEERLAKILAP
jgi:cytochrome c biogenesis protein CcmG, thiol:disulfide interchange protein DsbE